MENIEEEVQKAFDKAYACFLNETQASLGHFMTTMADRQNASDFIQAMLVTKIQDLEAELASVKIVKTPTFN